MTAPSLRGPSRRDPERDDPVRVVSPVYQEIQLHEPAAGIRPVPLADRHARSTTISRRPSALVADPDRARRPGARLSTSPTVAARPSRAWPRRISSGSTAARWSTPIPDGSSGTSDRPSRRPTRARWPIHPASLVLAEAGRHGDARAGPRGDPAGDLHPSAPLPLALDQHRRIDPVDRVTPLDVEQLERPGWSLRVAAWSAIGRRRGDDVGRPLTEARAARSASLSAWYRASKPCRSAT